MKKARLLLALAVLFPVVTLQAAPVSAERALAVAKKIFATRPATKAGSGALKILWDGEEVATKGAVQPAFYVIGRDGGGFVMIAGDDNVHPVLAISENGCFETEGMPEHVRWWMDMIKASVRSVKTPAPGIPAIWAKYTDTKSGAGILSGVTVDPAYKKTTPEWGQDAPFNAACPIDLDGVTRSYTGCLPLAMAEVVYYESKTGVAMPARGRGTVGGYPVWPGEVCPAAYDLSEMDPYDWATINSIQYEDGERPVTDAQKAALARLIADLGAIAHASYSKTGTGAYSEFLAPRMTEHFYFSPEGRYLRYDNYAPSEWIALLKSELLSRPVLCGANTETDGHAFVLDEYGTTEDGSDYFHVNLGWNGKCNAYYQCNNIDTGEYGKYTISIGMNASFYPVGGDPVFPYTLEVCSTYLQGGLVCLEGAVVDHKADFTLKLCILNSGFTAYDGCIRVDLLDKNDGFKETVLLDEAYQLDPSDYSLTLWDYSIAYPAYTHLSISSSLAFGDKLVVYYTDDKAKSHWVRMPFDTDGSVLGELPVMPAAFIQTKAAYAVGDCFLFKVINNDTNFDMTEWTITNTATGETVCDHRPQSDGEYRFTAAGTYKVEAAVASMDSEGAVTEVLVTYITVN